MAQEEAPSAFAEGENVTSTVLSTHEKKRPRLDLDPEPRKKNRSIFSQAFGTLKKARDQDSKLKTSDGVKRRTEIDNRIMGKITRDQTLVRQQDEAKRDKINANRKEEDLAIKEGIMRLRRTVFPRLAGFLLTTDDIPPDDSSIDPFSNPLPSSPSRKPKPTLSHPPRPSQPAPVYFLPAILTPSQQRFLAKQKAAAAQAVEEETKEWAMDKQKGIEEVAELRKNAKAAEALVVKADDDKPQPRPRSLSPSIGEDKMEVEEDKVGEDTPVVDEPPREKERLAGVAAMDAEDTIEY